MPHLRFRGISEGQLTAISSELVDELAEIITSAKDNFTFELVGSTFIYGGQRVTPDPLVEVLWFARSQAVQDRTAEAITRLLRSSGESREIDIAFIALTPSAYYSNGNHY